MEVIVSIPVTEFKDFETAQRGRVCQCVRGRSAARFRVNHPNVSVVEPEGQCHCSTVVADSKSNNNRLHKIVDEHVVTTMAEVGTANGTGADTRFDNPFALALDERAAAGGCSCWNFIMRTVALCMWVSRRWHLHCVRMGTVEEAQWQQGNQPTRQRQWHWLHCRNMAKWWRAREHLPY